MNLASAIAIVLASLPVPAVDREEEGRNERLQSVAIAINRATEHATCGGEFAERESCKPIAGDPLQVAAELIVLADAETALRSNVHRGDCGPHQCDAKRYRLKGVVHIEHQARGLWQLHRAPTWTQQQWDGLAGTSQTATSNGAWTAAKLLAGYRGKCGGTRGAFAGYGNGGGCSHKDAEARAKRTDIVRIRLMFLQHGEP